MSDYEPRIVKQLGDRFNEGKIRPSLLPVVCYEHILQILEMGAKKYGEKNWQKGLKYSTCLDSLERHLLAVKNGEDTDTESKKLHAGHIAVNALFLLYFQLNGRKDLDDRECYK